MVPTISSVLKKEKTDGPESDATTEANEANESEDEEKTLSEIIERHSKGVRGMTNEQLPTDRASQLQEAIDPIVRTFDYPTDVSIEYTSENGK